MLEKPDLPDEKIIACLQTAYGLRATGIIFLPLGADLNTAVYRAVAENGNTYFVKLRRGSFDDTSLELPLFLSQQGIEQIIAPLTTKTGHLRADLDAFRLILYPFVEGRNGYLADLSDHHWGELGAALKSFHATSIPAALSSRIRQEDYSPKWRESVKLFLEQIDLERYDDSIAAELAAFLRSKRHDILDLVRRAERLAWILQAQPPDFIVCHSDLHAGNILIDTNDALYIVDWDEPIRAPKERDLIVAGSGLMGGWRTPQEEEKLFYEAYGSAEVNSRALSYFRYERIIQDIAIFCEQLLLTNDGGQDRERSLHSLKSNFLPNGTMEIAHHSDKELRGPTD